MKIRARLQTRCGCGGLVRPGQLILWDPDTRRTVGCAACSPDETEHLPDQEWPGGSGLTEDDYPIFHD